MRATAVRIVLTHYAVVMYSRNLSAQDMLLRNDVNLISFPFMAVWYAGVMRSGRNKKVYMNLKKQVLLKKHSAQPRHSAYVFRVNLALIFWSHNRIGLRGANNPFRTHKRFDIYFNGLYSRGAECAERRTLSFEKEVPGKSGTDFNNYNGHKVAKFLVT